MAWPRQSWFVGVMNRDASEVVLHDHEPGVFLVRAISKKKYVLSVRHGDRAVIHFLIERAGETDHDPFTVNGDTLGSCTTLEAIIDKCREDASEFEFALTRPLKLDQTIATEDNPGPRLDRGRGQSFKLADKKSLSCIT
eukprot:m.84572 g.84572  ORF g.84572 m.84572 type:complete len:139 (-) comp11315_c0_seq4:257-673(-)